MKNLLRSMERWLWPSFCYLISCDTDPNELGGEFFRNRHRWNNCRTGF
jgi:hypothetical protein